MKVSLVSIKLLFLIGLLTVACKSGTRNETDVIDYSDIDLSDAKKAINGADTIGEGLPIFYNMYLSVEMSSLFETIGVVFNDDLLNKTTKSTDYITSSKKALNLGVYAVDLSYARVFEQFETAGKYFNSMQRLSEELGIPADYFVNTAKRFDRNINDKDSLIKIANEVYMATDEYLRDNEQFSAAAKIILGGWTEAMHIAFDIALNTKEIEFIERVAEQKYSLQNLLEMLSNYKDDEIVAHYIKKLQEVQEPFNSFTVEIDEDVDINADQGEKLVKNYLDKITILSKKVKEIRDEIIS
jgi:hypothetical protein